MSLTGKQKITLGVVAGYAIAWVADPLITIARLNIEKWAEDNKYDRLYQLTVEPPGWLVTIWEAVTGNLALGLVIGAAIVAFGDPVIRFAKTLLKRGPRKALEVETAHLREQRLMLKEKRVGQSKDDPAHFADGLYVGAMNVATGALKDEGYVEVSSRCFNATGHAIFVHRAKGAVTLRENIGSSGKKIGKLPPPLIAGDEIANQRIKNNSEFVVIWEQRVPNNIAKKILAIDGDHTLHFRFAELDIIVGSHDENLSARLPLWDGVSLSKSSEQLHNGRIIEARMEPIQIRFGSGQREPQETWPDFSKWDEKLKFKLFEAACLWEDLEPVWQMPDKAKARYKSLRDAVLNDDISPAIENLRDNIAFQYRRLSREKMEIDPNLEVSREALKDYATSITERPKFLVPAARVE